MHTRARWRLRLPVRAFARNIRIGCLLDVDGAAVGDGQKSGEAPVAVVCEGCTGLRTSPLIQPARTHPPPSPPPPQSSFSTPALSCSLHPCVRWFKRLALPPSIHPTPRLLPPSLPPSIPPSLYRDSRKRLHLYKQSTCLAQGTPRIRIRFGCFWCRNRNREYRSTQKRTN